jgi:hypothetical protein
VERSCGNGSESEAQTGETPLIAARVAAWPKPGNAELSKLVRHAARANALVAIQRSPQVKAAYEALLARGKKKKVAIIAIMRRLLHAIWGMLQHQQDFNPQLFHASPLPNS